MAPKKRGTVPALTTQGQHLPLGRSLASYGALGQDGAGEGPKPPMHSGKSEGKILGILLEEGEFSWASKAVGTDERR